MMTTPHQSIHPHPKTSDTKQAPKQTPPTAIPVTMAPSPAPTPFSYSQVLKEKTAVPPPPPLPSPLTKPVAVFEPVIAKGTSTAQTTTRKQTDLAPSKGPKSPPVSSSAAAAAASSQPAKSQQGPGSKPTVAWGSQPQQQPGTRPPLKYSSAVAGSPITEQQQGAVSSKEPSKPAVPTKEAARVAVVEAGSQQSAVIFKQQLSPVHVPSGPASEVFISPPAQGGPSAGAAGIENGKVSFGSLGQHPVNTASHKVSGQPLPVAPTAVVAPNVQYATKPYVLGQMKQMDIPRTMSAPPNLKQQELFTSNQQHQQGKAAVADASTAKKAADVSVSAAAFVAPATPVKENTQPQQQAPAFSTPIHPNHTARPMVNYPPSGQMYPHPGQQFQRPPMMMNGGPPFPGSGMSPFPLPPHGQPFYNPSAGMNPAYGQMDPRYPNPMDPSGGMMYPMFPQPGTYPGSGPSAMTPKKKSTPIKITRPGTKEEVKLPKKEETSEPIQSTTASVTSTTIPAKVLETLVTPKKALIKNPSTGAVITMKTAVPTATAAPIFDDSSKAATISAPVASATPTPAAKVVLPVSPAAAASKAVVVEELRAPVDENKVAEESIVDDSASPGEEMLESSTPSEADNDIEEGEIVEIPVENMTTEQVLTHKYPSVISERPTLLPSGGFRYSIKFMELIEPLIQSVPSSFDKEAASDVLVGPSTPTRSPMMGGMLSAPYGLSRDRGSSSLSPRLAGVSVSTVRPAPRTSTDRYNESLKSRTGSSFVGVMGVMGPPRITRTPSGPGARGGKPTSAPHPSMARGGSVSSRGGLSRSGSYRSEIGLSQLTKTENAWVPTSLAKPVTPDVNDETALTENVLRIVRGLLNKLTMEKFDRISEQILKCEIINERILAAVIDLIFDKVTDEPTFASMYALLCQRVAKKLPEYQNWISPDMKNNNFRRLLLFKCQSEFEAAKKWAIQESADLRERVAKRKELEKLSTEEKLKIAEEDYERKRMKRKALGNTRFVGELFIKELLSEKVVNACITQLLEKVSEPEEEDIESLCKLMTTAGHKIDKPEASKIMESYFIRITELSNLTGALPARIRFMLKDLIDLRKSKWANVKQTGPKTIAEVHKEAIMAQRQEEAALRNVSRGHSGSRGGGMPSRDQQQRRAMDDRSNRGYGGGGDDWQPSRGSSGRGGPMAPSPTAKFGAFTSNSSEITHFGPGGNHVRTKESPTQPTAAANKFEGLLDEKEHAMPDETATVVVAPPVSPTPKVLTPVQLEKKRDGMVREWLQIFDIKDVILSCQELEGQLDLTGFMNALFAAVIEERVDSVKKSAALFPALYEASLITVDQVKSFLDLQLSCLEDIIIDSPECIKYLGIFISRILGAKIISFEELPELLKQVATFSHGGKKAAPLIIAEAIRAAKETFGEERVRGELIGGSDLSAFWYGTGSDALITSWTKSYSLEWLSTPVESEPSAESLAGALEAKLSAGESTKSIVTWCQQQPALHPSVVATSTITLAILKHLISQTVTFTSALGTSGKAIAVDPSSEGYAKQRSILTNLQPLLKYVIDGKDEHALQILYACQTHCYDLGNPKELLHHLFRLLYELGILSRSIMLAWKAKPLPNHPSSREAVKQLSGWFRALDNH